MLLKFLVLMVWLKLDSFEEFNGTKKEYRKYLFSGIRKYLKQELLWKPLLGIPFVSISLYFILKSNLIHSENFFISSLITILITIFGSYLIGLGLIYIELLLKKIKSKEAKNNRYYRMGLKQREKYV